MNKKNIIYKIKDHIRYFKNSLWKIGSIINPVILSSKVPISEYDLFNSVVYPKVNELLKTINTSPKYIIPGTKEKSIQSKSYSVKSAVYNNRRKEKFSNRSILPSGSVAVALVNKEGKTFDSRVQGGGFKKRYIEENIHKDIKLLSLTDIAYPGYPIAASSVLSIDIPKNLLDRFSIEQIREKTQKYITLGIFPAINTYE